MNIRMYNIQDGRIFLFPQILREVQLGKYEFMLIMETKIPDAVYFKNRLRYGGVCLRVATTTAIGTQGGMILVTKERLYGWDI